MADYFDRLAARAKGEGATARPPARTIVEPGPVDVPGSDDGAVEEILADSLIQGRATRAEPGLAWSAQPPAAAGSSELRSREPPWVPPAPEASLDGLPQEREDLIRPPDDQSPSTPRSGPGAPVPAEARRARSAAESRLSAPAPVARAEPAHLPHPGRDAQLRPSNEGAGPDDAPRRRDDRPGIRPLDEVQSRATPVGSPSAPPAPPAEPSPQTVISVSIGRVEVRATAPATTPAPPARVVRATPRLTLDAYLERAGERRRR